MDVVFDRVRNFVTKVTASRKVLEEFLSLQRKEVKKNVQEGEDIVEEDEDEEEEHEGGYEDNGGDGEWPKLRRVLRLRKEVETRWNSTYWMLERCESRAVPGRVSQRSAAQVGGGRPTAATDAADRGETDPNTARHAQRVGGQPGLRTPRPLH